MSEEDKDKNINEGESKVDENQPKDENIPSAPTSDQTSDPVEEKKDESQLEGESRDNINAQTDSSLETNQMISGTTSKWNRGHIEKIRLA